MSWIGRRAAVIPAFLALLAGTTTGVTLAAFSATSANSANTFSAAADFVAPTLERSTVTRATSGIAQHIHPGSSYHLYGQLTDAGNPASGIASATANLGAITSGQTTASLTSGAFSFAGISYNHRTAALTADSTLSACSYTPTVTATDNVGNTRTENASKVMIDRDLLSDYHIRIDGAATGDQNGRSVANAGDVNGDGRPDALVGATLADNNGRADSGSGYVVFGQASATTIDLAALGGRGYRLDGAAAGDQNGRSVANAGDVNGDGRPDALISATLADNNGRADSGAAYVVFGKTTTTTIDLASLGSQGYRIDGAAAGDNAGYTVADAGDVNGDGRPDALIGALSADNNGRADSGSAYVVFGKTTTTTIDLAALGGQGYRIDGAAASDSAGRSVANAGDVNGDNRPDALIGARVADNNGRADSGSAYVVFGKTTTTTIDLAALGGQGYRIDGAAAGDLTGAKVWNAGDVDGDGRPDALIAAVSADNNGRANSGSAYVVFGKTTTSAIDLASLGSQGYRIDGAAAGDEAGASLAGIGDVNGDGRPDALIGAWLADDNGRADSGSGYVVFGKASASTVDLASPSSQSYRLDGAAAGDLNAWPVSGAGDVNGDGRTDMLLGATLADNNGRADSGSVYIFASPTCSG